MLEAARLTGAVELVLTGCRPRCGGAPTAWLPDYNHGDFPAAFRAAARAFLTCAEADTRRLRLAREGKEGKEDFQESESGVSLGDMPQEVLLRVLALAAVPISDWIEESAAGSI